MPLGQGAARIALSAQLGAPLPVLYVVSTPIGNLEDITLRALRILQEVGLIAAEDTRVTRRLLERHDISTPVSSYNEHNKRTKTARLVEKLAEKDVALVSDAGTPGVNDPGADLVSAASEAGFPVVSVPGPSSITASVSVSGITGDGFVHMGFLPRRRGDKKRALGAVMESKAPIVLLEAPHRLLDSLEDLLEVLGDRNVVVCRELTKLHEEIFRGSVSAAHEHFREPRGEFCIVVEGAGESLGTASRPESTAIPLLEELRARGARAKDSVSLVAAATGLPKKRVYELWVLRVLS
jgi:16S rRNA (cytidine1402-2'-O)-methyltransferase